MKRGIDEPQAMLNEALAEAENPNGKRVSAAASSGEDTSSAAEGSWGSRIYKAVMTGVSYMIPFVAAGGIIVALGFILEAITMPNLGDVDTEKSSPTPQSTTWETPTGPSTWARFCRPSVSSVLT